MCKQDFWEEHIVGESIDQTKKGHNMNEEEPSALKRSQIVLIEKVFYCLHHFALDNLLYDAKNYQGFKESFVESKVESQRFFGLECHKSQVDKEFVIKQQNLIILGVFQEGQEFVDIRTVKSWYDFNWHEVTKIIII